MPFPFTLPTTSYVPFSDYFASSTHPSLPLACTSSRTVLRDALKKHARLAPAAQPAHLNIVLDALKDYIPYLFALDAGLSGQSVSGEEIDVVLLKELEVEWRCTLSSKLAGRKPPRQKLRSLDTELFFVLSTLAYTHTLLARTNLGPLHQPSATGFPPSQDQRTKAIAAAMQHLLTAHSLHTYLLNLHHASATTHPQPIDIQPAVLSAMASLSLSSATLITVSKDDPYPAHIITTTSTSNAYLIGDTPLPSVRAHLLARLCLAAADHASRAVAALRNTSGVENEVVRFAGDLRDVARARGARFLGVDAEGKGKVGEGLGWIRVGKKELGMGSEGGEEGGLARLRREWKGRREERKGKGEWGWDAGKAEERRVLEWLEARWGKMNDTVSSFLFSTLVMLVRGFGVLTDCCSLRLMCRLCRPWRSCWPPCLLDANITIRSRISRRR
jgi:hypothetical protein